MPYELKPSEEMDALAKKKEEEKALYGDKEWNPELEAPKFVETSVSVNTGKSFAKSQKHLGIVYKIIGVLLLALLVFGAIKFTQHFVGSGGDDISQYLDKKEAEISAALGIQFEQHDEMAKGIQQYSGGKVTVREGDDLQIVYVDGRQVGVCTSGRGYRFFGIGINEAKTDIAKDMTYKSDETFVVMNDLMGGRSTSTYYANRANNTCFVITVNDDSGRVVYLSYFTDMALITKNLSF